MTRRRSARRPLTALAALAAVLLVLPAAALPAAPDGAAGVVTECDGACPMMAAQAARMMATQALRHGGHRMAAGGHGASAPACGRGAADETMSCCASPGSHPAVPLDEAAPSPTQQVAAPAAASLPAVAAPVASPRTHAETAAPLPPGPALYTLHSSLLN
jgi:hypothetical protein